MIAFGCLESLLSKTCLLSPDLKSSRKAIRLAGSLAVPYLELMADIILTPSAAARVAAIAKQQRKPAILRMAVEGGGCSGFQYRFGLADEIEGDDVSVEQDGVKIVVDAVSLDLVRGSAVDFVEVLGGSAFKMGRASWRERVCQYG